MLLRGYRKKTTQYDFLIIINNIIQQLEEKSLLDKNGNWSQTNN